MQTSMHARIYGVDRWVETVHTRGRSPEADAFGAGFALRALRAPRTLLDLGGLAPSDLGGLALLDGL